MTGSRFAARHTIVSAVQWEGPGSDPRVRAGLRLVFRLNDLEKDSVDYFHGITEDDPIVSKINDFFSVDKSHKRVDIRDIAENTLMSRIYPDDGTGGDYTTEFMGKIGYSVRVTKDLPGRIQDAYDTCTAVMIGDWIVVTDLGDTFVYTDEMFQKYFRSL